MSLHARDGHTVAVTPSGNLRGACEVGVTPDIDPFLAQSEFASAEEMFREIARVVPGYDGPRDELAA